MESQSTIPLVEYNRQVEQTDLLPKHDLNPVLFGLFGEVGNIMTVAKKHYRESDAFTGYKRALEEEFGDVLWYLAALCRRLDVGIDEVFESVLDDNSFAMTIAATDLSAGPVAQVAIAKTNPELETTLLQLGDTAAGLLAIGQSSDNAREKLHNFARLYTQALRSTSVPFTRIVQLNIEKVRSRFLEPDVKTLPNFDCNFAKDEQLPDKFEIRIVQRANGRCYIQWNGVFIGDPLSDNIADSDGYRFHDVLHFSNAAILHWSPTFRALIKHKRKSDPKVDEAQDGGRAIVVEEGLTAWIFSRAKELDFFANSTKLSFDLLKTIQQFVSGYEVEACPLNLWEKAILRGYEVFRQVRDNNGGIIVANRNARTIVYKPLKED